MTHFLFTLWDGAGALPPELSVARALVERGHRVSVLSDPTAEADALAVGADFRLWREAPHLRSRRAEDDYIRDQEARTPPQLIARLSERLICTPSGLHAAETTQAIEALRPDALVSSSMLLGTQIAGEAAGLPVTATMPPGPCCARSRPACPRWCCRWAVTSSTTPRAWWSAARACG